MKRIISLILTLILMVSVYMPVHGGPVRFTETDRENYYIEDYYILLFDNFNSLFDDNPWPFLIQRELFAYQGFVSDLYRNPARRVLLPASFWFADEAPAVERYIEILANFMLLMEHELNDVHNHMAEADALKTMTDYAFDIASIIMSSAKLDKAVNNFGRLAYSAINVSKECYYSFKLLNKVLLDYENNFNFLTVIIQYSDNRNLVEAAKVLRNNVERVMEYRLGFFIENADRVAEFVARDVFLDILLMEAITNPVYLGQLGLSLYDEIALTKLAEGYKNLGNLLAGANIARGLGVFAADMLVGISNVLNRVIEMQAMYDINQALIRDTENIRRNVHSGSDIDAIEHVFQNMRSMLYVNARGDYLLYRMVMYDGQWLSLIFRNQLDFERWYSQIQRSFLNLTAPLNYFWPEREWFVRDTEDNLDSEQLFPGIEEPDTEENTDEITEEQEEIEDWLSNLLDFIINWLNSLFELDNQVINKDNDTATETEENYFVIASGGGYNIVGIMRSSTGGDSDMVGVKDDYGNWIHPLSENHPFIVDGLIRATNHNRVVIMAGGGPVTPQVSAAARRFNIVDSYTHYEGAIFSLVSINRRTARLSDLIIISERHYDARNNILLDDGN